MTTGPPLVLLDDLRLAMVPKFFMLPYERLLSRVQGLKQIVNMTILFNNLKFPDNLCFKITQILVISSKSSSRMTI